MLRLDKEEEEQELKLRGSLEFRADFQSLRTFSHSPPHTPKRKIKFSYDFFDPTYFDLKV